MTHKQQAQRFEITNGPPLWEQRGLIFSLALDNFPGSRKRPMNIPNEYRRWVSFELASKNGSKNSIFDAIIKTAARDDFYDEIWHITGEGAFLQTIKDIKNDGARTDIRGGPLTKFKAKYHVHTRKGLIEIFGPGTEESHDKTIEVLKWENIQIGDIFVTPFAGKGHLLFNKVVETDGHNFGLKDSKGWSSSSFFFNRDGISEDDGFIIKEKRDGTIEIYAGKEFLRRLEEARQIKI